MKMSQFYFVNTNILFPLMWSTNQLKTRFVSFFEKRGHKCLPSSSVVPKNDPTLLFTNSGMVQFKNIFLGEKAQYKRVVTSQRCIRAGGKHNDLDDVGKDNYHHTFFEMLGNWSFGDYFKEEAIEFAYDFLINDLKLNKDNIYVTIYEDMDQESKRIWSKFIDPSRIIPSSYKDNFWEMGEYGPCGPCTEIHYDRIGNRDASHLVNKDDPDVIEFWNIVFMEFERTPKGLEPLKIKHIDTGIGLERLLSILNGVKSNYLIDSFQEIIRFIESKTGFVYKDGNSIEDVAFRVLADHSRTTAVCLNDKVAFSSEGVGYVLRRVLRRAIRYAHDILKLEKGVFSQCVKKAAEFMEMNIDVSVVDQEEALFMKTLVNGLNQLIKMADQKKMLDGNDIFVLYDTYGFPVDLTELIANEKNIPFTKEGFEEAVNKAKNLSRSVKKIVTVNFDFPKTDDSFKYEINGIDAELKGIVVDNELVSTLKEDVPAYLIFDKTCFYGECGGQVGDKGVVEFFDEKEVKVGKFDVVDTQIQRGYVLHEGKLTGTISKSAKLSYNEDIRAAIRANHSTVHILNYFLRTFMETEQQGSLVDSEKCRFDFESKKLSDETLESLENKINDFISTNATVTVNIYPKDAIFENNDIIKMSNEDYPEKVRVINMDNGDKVIKEVCGGTHVSNTSEIKMVRLLSESGVKSNTRRIVAVSGLKAIEADDNSKKLRELLKNGEIVNIDCLLSIKDKREIEMLNKVNSKKIQKELEDVVLVLKKDIEASLLNFRVSAINKNAVFSYECAQLSKFSRKDVLKSLNILIGGFDCVGFLFVKKDDEVIFIANASGLDSIEKKISDVFPSCNVRLIKDQIQGSVSIDKFSSEKLIESFN